MLCLTDTSLHVYISCYIIVSQCTVKQNIKSVLFVGWSLPSLSISLYILVTENFEEGIEIIIRTWIVTEFEKWVIKRWHRIPKTVPKFTLRFICYGYCAYLQKPRTQLVQLRNRKDMFRFPAGRRNFSLPENCARRLWGPYSFIFSRYFGSLLGAK